MASMIDLIDDFRKAMAANGIRLNALVLQHDIDKYALAAKIIGVKVIEGREWSGSLEVTGVRISSEQDVTREVSASTLSLTQQLAAQGTPAAARKGP